MEKVKRSYYAVLPANIRYDNDITPNAKLLYAEITALCNEKGYCWATNEYFAELYNVSDRTITRLVRQLCDKEYIVIELIDNTKRRIYLKNSINNNLILKNNEDLNYDWLNDKE